MKHVILFLLTAVIFFACNKKKNCDQSTNEGIIEEYINIASCAAFLDTEAVEIVINDDSTYKAFFPDTTNCSPPSVDFNKYTVLGHYASGGGCNIAFLRNVKSVTNENKYHYKITVHQCGMCNMLGMDYNFVTVPKIPKGWDVTFEIEKKTN